MSNILREIEDSIDDVLKNANQCDEYKRRMKRLIELIFENQYQRDDVKEVLELIEVSIEEEIDEITNS